LSTDEQDIIRTLERVFAALGHDDRASVEALFCPDFADRLYLITQIGP